MSSDSIVQGAHAPPWRHNAVLRRISTANPFYVISAGLFLFGLRVSFGADSGDIEIGALMAGLASYTLLLAATALVLVRFGNVWDDVRTVLLLVVLMFLATSVTCDDLFISRPRLAIACELAGFATAVFVSEIIFFGARLSFPAWFRGPYYLILGLFFLYPVALSPFLKQPNSEAVQWGMFGFASAAGLAFLTLLPAIRRGPEYVHNNGSPWRWPLYPWAIFGVFALAVPARAFLLCFSMHWLDRIQGNATIFGAYFLVPFGLCLAILLLEAGRVSRNTTATTVALLVPFGLIGAVMWPHGIDPVYRSFVEIVQQRLGGNPLFLTLAASTLFYLYAGLRRFPGSLGTATGMLTAMALLGPDSSHRPELTPAPVAGAFAIQLALGIWRRCAGHWLLAAVLGAILIGADPFRLLPTFRILAALHVFVILLAAGGTICADEGARRLRLGAGLAVLVLAALAATASPPPLRNVPEWLFAAYPIAAATALGCYGFLLSDRRLMSFAAVVLAGVLGQTLWRGYQVFRTLLAGFDQLLLSIVLFALAVLVSVAKAGRLPTWPRRAAPPPEPESVSP